MKVRKPRTSRALLDVLFCIFTVILLLPHDPSAKDIEWHTKYLLRVSWDDNNSTDVDTYILAPDNSKLWFRAKDLGHMVLERDDLGRVNDSIPLNEENSSIRKLMDGWYYVSIHNYARYQEGTVKVIFIQLDPYKILYSVNVPVPIHNNETPIFKFFVDNEKIIKILPSDRVIRNVK